MDPHRFDQLSRLLGHGQSRRSVAHGFLAAVAAMSPAVSSASSAGGNDEAGGERTITCIKVGARCRNKKAPCCGAAKCNTKKQKCLCQGSGRVMCGSACVDLRTDQKHCGACKARCSKADGYVCQTGECICPNGTTECNGQCADLASDSYNCGACGTTCSWSSDEVCRDGLCQCPVGWEMCREQCRDIRTDPKYCGGCTGDCLDGGACVSGVCQCAGVACHVGYWETGSDSYDLERLSLGSGSSIWVGGGSKVSHVSSTGGVLGTWGEFGVGPDELSEVVGVGETEDGKVLVLDDSNPPTLKVFSATGAFLESRAAVFGGKTPREVKDLFRAPAGHFYLWFEDDEYDIWLSRLTAAGQFDRLIPMPAAYDERVLIRTVGDDRLFGINNDRPGVGAYQITQSGLAELWHQGQVGVDPDEITDPNWMLIDNLGRLHTYDYDNNRVQVRSAQTGAFLFNWTSELNPFGYAAMQHPDGHILILRFDMLRRYVLGAAAPTTTSAVASHGRAEHSHRSRSRQRRPQP